MKILEMIKGVISYLGAIAFATVFALFCSGRVGWFLVLTFLLAPFFSLILMWIMVEKINVCCEISSDLIGKGEKVKLNFWIANKSIFPSLPIKIHLHKSPGLTCDVENVIVSVLPKKKKKIELEYSGKICGPGFAGIESIRVYDYFGIASMKIKTLDEKNLHQAVMVLPDITDMTADNELLNNVIAASNDADDSEDTVEVSGGYGNGYPGYENRGYVPGDSLKKINWKLSAKKDKLLVRLDENLAAASICVVLDSTFAKEQLDSTKITDEEFFPTVAQCAIEDSLGMVQALIMHNYAVTYYFCGKGSWEKYEIVDERGITELRVALASYEFSEDVTMDRLPMGEFFYGKGSVSVVFTPICDELLNQWVNDAKLNGANVLVQSATF